MKNNNNEEKLSCCFTIHGQMSRYTFQ